MILFFTAHCMMSKRMFIDYMCFYGSGLMGNTHRQRGMLQYVLYGMGWVGLLSSKKKL